MTKKKVETLEKERGVMFITNIDLNQRLSDEEFDEMLTKQRSDYVGVAHDDRIKFLKDNGYDVTRENMVNPDLSTLPQKSES